jgi:hypothetical protein
MTQPETGEVSVYELAEQICEKDDSIMFCVIIDSEGEILATKSRPGSKGIVQKESDVELLARRWAIVRGIDDTADKLLGVSRSAIIFREKITLMSVNAAGGRCAFVGARPDFDIRKIREIEQAVARLKTQKK